MNYTQNQKISQITPSTLIIGIDIAKDKHVARAQDDRGLDFGKRLVFENRIFGFEALVKWAEQHQEKHKKESRYFRRRTYGTLLEESCLLFNGKRLRLCRR